MSERTLSRTALGAAHLRAVHQSDDALPHILEDPVSALLLGPELMGKLEKSPNNSRHPEALALRAHVTLRSRFAEDQLAVAFQRGVRQYVILGAGLDTFALRQPEWARQLRIFEVDHAGSQEFKRWRIQEAGLSLPENLRFVTIDFERESLRDGLTRGGVSFDAPTFFSWLGVTMYLQPEAIAAVLGTVAAFPADSEIVLTFTQPPPLGAPADQAANPLARRVERVGEPFVSYFTPEAMARQLRAAGFSVLEFLTPEQSFTRYFSQRPADLPTPRRTAMVSAMV